MVVASGITSDEVRSLANHSPAVRAGRIPGLLKCLVVSGDDRLRHRLDTMAGDINIGCVRLGCIHPFRSPFAIAHNHGHRAGMREVAMTGPSYDIPVIQIVVLRSVGELFAHLKEFIDEKLV